MHHVLQAAAWPHLRQLRAKDIAMIFQDPRAHINPVRTVGDFLTEGLRTNQGLSPARARMRAEQLLAEVGIADPARCYRQFPHELSGGMLQRAFIAAALSTGPRQAHEAA